LARRDINQVINASISSLLLKVAPHVYSNGTSKELLCLYGTVACQYRGARYNIPIEIWLQQDHPIVPPLAYVRPTSDMYVSPKSADVQPDGTVIIPYLRNWRHVKNFILYLFSHFR
jgi:ESCRT-I complex subunit TSG101